MSITLTVGGRINKVTRNMVDVEVNLQSIVSVTYLLFHNGHSPALKAACERCLKKPPLVVSHDSLVFRPIRRMGPSYLPLSEGLQTR